MIIRILLVCLLMYWGRAQAQLLPGTPSCWLATGDAKGYNMGNIGDIQWMSYWCSNGRGDYGPNPVIGVRQRLFAIVHPQLPNGATTKAVAEAYWNANKGFHCRTPPDWALEACTIAYNAAIRSRPLPDYVVRTNGSSPTRPTYPVTWRRDDGTSCTGPATGCNPVRGRTSNGTVNVLSATGRPTACDPTVSIDDYRMVRENTVTLCSSTN